MRLIISLLPASLSLLFLSACSNEPSLGDRLIAQGESTRALGTQWNKGNALIEEGREQKAEGRKLIEKGDKLVERGARNIERGEELRTEAEAAAR